jgi:very-short-patch-repair endonuclease
MTNKLYTLQFLAYIKAIGLPKPEQEYRIYIKGKIKGEKPCRIDFCWPDIRLAIECEGGDIWRGKSRHTTGEGYTHDLKKYNWLSKNGWTLLRYTWKNIDYAEIKAVYEKLTIVKNKIEDLK